MTDADPTTGSEPRRAAPQGVDVVEELRFPGEARLREGWRGLPLLAQTFVVLALVDLVIRALGIGGLSLFIDLAQPLTVVLLLPHLALVLIPVAVLLRRPDAATEMPLVLWGAVSLALVELLSGPLLTFFPGTAGSLGTWTLLQVVAVAARGAGYVALALGLATLTRSAPGPSVLGLSNLVTFLIAGAALTSILLQLVLPPTDFGDPAWTSQVRLVNLLGLLPNLAFAFFARVVIRGSVDIRRPVVATYTATGAVVLAAVLDFFTFALNVLLILQLALAISQGPVGPGVAFGIPLVGGLSGVLIVVAFALGLADPSGRMPRPGAARPFEADDEPEPVHWPTAGGEVPTYRPVEQPPAESKESQA